MDRGISKNLDAEDGRPEGGIGTTTLDPRLAIKLEEGDGGTWTVAALAGLATKVYPRMAAMLRRLEWSGGYTDSCDSLIACCPDCNAEAPPRAT